MQQQIVYREQSAVIGVHFLLTATCEQGEIRLVIQEVFLVQFSREQFENCCSLLFVGNAGISFVKHGEAVVISELPLRIQVAAFSNEQHKMITKV